MSLQSPAVAYSVSPPGYRRNGEDAPWTPTAPPVGAQLVSTDGRWYDWARMEWQSGPPPWQSGQTAFHRSVTQGKSTGQQVADIAIPVTEGLLGIVATVYGGPAAGVAVGIGAAAANSIMLQYGIL